MSPAGTGEDSALGFPHTWVTAVLTPDHSSALEHWLLGRGKEKGRENRRKGAGRLGFICRQLGNTHRGLQVTRVAPGSVLAKEQGRSDVLSEVFSFSSCSPKRAQIRTWQHAFPPQQKFLQGSMWYEQGLAMGSVYRPRAQFWVLGDNCLKWVTTGDVIPSKAQSML